MSGKEEWRGQGDRVERSTVAVPAKNLTNHRKYTRLLRYETAVVTEEVSIIARVRGRQPTIPSFEYSPCSLDVLSRESRL